jgi:hypothetical protein
MELIQAIKNFTDLAALIPLCVIGVGMVVAFVAALPHILRERARTRAMLDDIERRQQ